MAGAHAEHHLLGIEVFEGEAGHLFRRGETANNQIEIADPQLFEENGILSGYDLDARSGVLAQEHGHCARHDPC